MLLLTGLLHSQGMTAVNEANQQHQAFLSPQIFLYTATVNVTTP